MYNCNRCGYETNRLGNFKTHLQRKIPCKFKKQDVDMIIQFNELFIKKKKDFKCKYCDKTYNQRQGKERHQKTCHFLEKEQHNDEDLKKIIMKLLTTNELLQKQIGDLIPKVGNNTINSNINSNNTTNNIIINGFGFETITHIIEDPDFFEKMKNLITDNETNQAIIEMYKLVRLDPKNNNLLLEKANSRFIQTHNEIGQKIKKTKIECYNNIIIKLKELLITYLETNCSYKFKFKTIVRTNIIKQRFEIDKDQEYEDNKDDDDRLCDKQNVNEIADGFINLLNPII